MAESSAGKRERLFDLYSKHFSLYKPEVRDVFVCPLCLRGFRREALAGPQPALTLAHVIPESLGGTFCTLACVQCNNEGGSQLEAALVERFVEEDRLDGLGKTNARMSGEFGNVGVDRAVCPETQAHSFHVIAPQSNLANIESLKRHLAEAASRAEDFGFTLRFRLKHQPDRVKAAVYQSAYLLLCSYFGCEFMFRTQYAMMRKQILQPLEQIWEAPIVIPTPESASSLMQGRKQLVMFLTEPASAILTLLRYRPQSGRERVVGVVLQGPGGPEVPKVEGATFRGTIIPYLPEALLDQKFYFDQAWRHTQHRAA